MKPRMMVYRATFLSSTNEVLSTCEVCGVNMQDAMGYIFCFMPRNDASRVKLELIGPYQESDTTAAERAAGVQ